MTLNLHHERRAKALVGLFFAVIVLLGVLTVSDYGRTWDELGEMRIFRMAIMEYGEALPFETGFHQALAGMGIIPLSQSIEMDHNFSLYYPIAWAACNPAMDEAVFTIIWRVHTWLIFTLGLFSLYAICRHMGLNRPLCCLAVLLLLITPRFFADGHYNNKDLALMTAVGLTLWQTLRLKEKPTYPRAFTFALAAGLCVNTRIIGGAVCCLCGLMVVLALLRQRRLNAHALRVGLCALFAAMVCYVLLTPALLNDPIGYINYVVRNSLNFTRWNGSYMFMGHEVDLSSGKPPFYYLPVMILLTTPLLQLALVLAGSLFILHAVAKKRLDILTDDHRFAALTCMLAWLLPLLACVVLNTRIYNGWRHFYFLYLPMIATAIWGVSRLWGLARRRAWLRRMAASGLAAVLLMQGVLLCLNHPVQYAYYNPLVNRESIAQRYELDYYNVSLHQALLQLLEHEKDAPVIRVACTDARTRSGYALTITYLTPEQQARLELVDYDESLRSTFYTLANTSYRITSGFELPANMRPVITVQSYGATLCTLYACDPQKEVSP